MRRSLFIAEPASYWRRLRTIFVGAWFVALLMPAAARSFDSTPFPKAGHARWSTSDSPLNVPISQLMHRSITAEEGAPIGISSIAQTPDGFLWLATPHGLFRFDGVTFQQMFQEQLPASGALKVWVDEDGSLWVGSFVGGVSHIKDGAVVNYSGHGLPGGTVFSIIRRSDGRIWMASILDVAYLDGDHWVSASKHYGLPFQHPANLSLDSDGTLWIKGQNNSFALPVGSEKFQVKPKDAAASSGVGLPSSVAWTDDDEGDGEAVTDSSGAIWLSRLGGFERFRHPSEGRAAAEKSPEFVKGKDQLTDAYVSNFLEDRDGNMWVATQKGLDLFRRPRFTRVAFPDPVRNPGVAAGDQGDVWITSFWQSLFHLSRSNELTSDLSLKGDKLEPALKPERGISLAIRDQSGSVWFAGTDTFVRLHNNQIEHFELPDALKKAGTQYQSLAFDEKGAVWVTISVVGLWKYSNGTWSINGGRTDLPTQQWPLSLVLDPLKGLWLGYASDHLALLHNDRIENFYKEQGLNVGNVLTINPFGQHVWIGGDQGVSLFTDGSFHSLFGVGDQRFRSTTGIVETQSGELWINGALGIFRIPADELRAAEKNANYAVHFDKYDAADGLDGASINVRPKPTLIIGGDGRIWATTSSGVVWIDPAHLQKNSSQPTPLIESVTADGQTYNVEGDGAVRLPKHANAIRVDYTSAVLGIPSRAQFRYRLVGFDPAWQTVSGRRQAFYTNLPPAEYHFELQASNEDGVWSKTTASARINVTPTFWQTRWFTALWIISIIVILIVLYIVRIRQIEVREWVRRNERERIARDMHDTILQSVQSLIFQVHTASRLNVDGDLQRREMDAAIGAAQEALVEGRDKLMELRGQDESSYGFVEKLMRLDTVIGIGDTPKYSVIVKGTPRTLRSKAGDELYQVAKELVTNAVHHADAEHVEILISYGRWKLLVRVNDDGCGVDRSLSKGMAPAGHFGLLGVRERVRAMGAHISIRTRAEGGTQVEVRVSAVRVYARSPRRQSEHLGTPQSRRPN